MRYVAIVVMTCWTGMAAAEDLEWHPIQTYSMIPDEPERQAARGVTVNGLWAGFGMAEAVRGTTFVTSPENAYPVAYKYKTIKEYVDANHAQGVLVPGTLMGTAGYGPLRMRYPELEMGACVGADGERAYWNPPGGYFMCANNPAYGEALLAVGTEALDAGVDLIVIDEIQGNETCYYWSNEPGFCDACLDAYRKHLGAKFSAQELKERFQIDDLQKFDFAKALGGQRTKAWGETKALFKELWRMQERNNFENKKKLVEGLRAHMDVIGRHVPISGNVPNVGSTWAGNHWLPGVKWSTLLDFLAFENGEQEMGSLPREKWLADERLAAAAFPLPSCTVMVYPPAHAAEQEGKRAIMFQSLFYEAVANQSSTVNYFQPRFFPQTEAFWQPTFDAQKFIRDHRDLLAPKATIPSNVAILYIENEGQRVQIPAYQGMAQALAESQIPFTVLVDGGDGFTPVLLDLAKLTPFGLMILPNTLFLADKQKAALEQYLQQGGKVLLCEASQKAVDSALGDTGDTTIMMGYTSGVHPSWRPKSENVVTLGVKRVDGEDIDLATAYFRAYEDADRAAIAKTVTEAAAPHMQVSGVDRTACVYPYIQESEKRLLFHMVNSDYDASADAMRAKKNITIRLKKPDFYESVREGKLYSIDRPGEEAGMGITPSLDGEFIQVTVPELKNYNLLVL